jgi:ferritin-like metal-binding protein YciE
MRCFYGQLIEEEFMQRRGVSKANQARSGRRQIMAGMGMVTKSSSGRPKASPRGAPRGHTRENQTTSTSVPSEVPKNFLNRLGEMHTAERELTLALPLVAKAAKSKDLKTLLQIHLKETKGHVKVLEDVAESLGTTLPSKSCKEMTKLITEGVKVIAQRLVSGDKDPELIRVGQDIEQFEIDNYTPLVAQAERMEFTHETALLTSILNQEKLANELLEALGQGRGPLDKLVKKVSLEHAGRQHSRSRLPVES